MTEEIPTCTICGEPMQPGEEMFKYHGSLGPCPKPPLPKHSFFNLASASLSAEAEALEGLAASYLIGRPGADHRKNAARLSTAASAFRALAAIDQSMLNRLEELLAGEEQSK